jgi:hypothetical protein
MVRPLRKSSCVIGWTHQFPAAEEVAIALSTMAREDRFAFVRLWMSEGVPYCFAHNPWLYEDLREWLAESLGVHPKEVTLIGSGRFGFSMSSRPQFGRLFSAESDLDLSAVSSELFSRLSAEYLKWRDDFEAGRVQPRNENEARYWRQNIREVPSKLKRGFIDPYATPNLEQFPVTRSVSDLMWRVPIRLKASSGGFLVRRASLRVYDSWRAFVAQMRINLDYLIDSL